MWRPRSFRRKLCASILLIVFFVSSVLGSPAFAETDLGGDDIELATGSYIVSLLKYDSTSDDYSYLTNNAAGQQPQISEAGILDVKADGSMQLTYKLYGASAWGDTYVYDASTSQNTTELLTKSNADEAENTVCLTVNVKDRNSIIRVNGYRTEVGDNITYGIGITGIGDTVEALEQSIRNGDTLQYDFTYDVFKRIRDNNYITASGVATTDYNVELYNQLFEQAVKVQCASEDSLYPVTATYNVSDDLTGDDALTEFAVLQSVAAPSGDVDGIRKEYLSKFYKNGLYLAGSSYTNVLKDGQVIITYESREDLVFGADVRFDTAQTANNISYHYFGRLHPVLQSSMIPMEELVFSDDASGVTVSTTNKAVPASSQLQVAVNSETAYYSSGETDDSDIVNYVSYYDSFVDMAQNEQCIVYTLSLTDESGNTYTSGSIAGAAVITLPIPADWTVNESEGLSVLFYSNYGGVYKPQKLSNTVTSVVDGVTNETDAYTIDWENRQVLIDSSVFGFGTNITTWQFLTRGSFVLYTEASSVNPAQLNDGIYEITARTTKSTDNGMPSMSNEALNHTAYLVKEGERLDLYLQFRSMMVNGNKCYVGGLRSINADTSEEFGNTYLDYYNITEDGSGSGSSLLDNAIYDADTEFACVQAMKLQLNGGKWNDTLGGYLVGVVAPIMAALNNLSADEVGTMGCALLLSGPHLLTSDTTEAAIAQFIPVYEEQPDVLRRAIDAAKKLYPEADYTADSYQTLTKALDAAEAVYAVGSTGEAVQAEVEKINAAAAQLVSLGNVKKDALEKALTDAKAISNADSTYTEASYQALQAAINAAQAVYEDKRAGQSSVDAQVTALKNAVAALVRSAQLANGDFEVGVTLRKAYADEASMGNASLDQIGILHVNDDGSAKLTMNFHSMSFSGFTGYLGYLRIMDKEGVGRNNLGGWAYDESNFIDVLEVAEQYDYMPNDEYTGDKSTDPDIGGKNYQYPKTYVLSIDNINRQNKPDANGNPVEGRYWEEVYVQVYAPVMASVPDTSGRQEARMLIDFSNYDAAGNQTDTTALEALIAEAEAVEASASDNDVADTLVNALKTQILAAQDLLGRNPTEAQVTAQTAALQSAMDAVTAAMAVDRTELTNKIVAAKTINNADDKYTDASFKAFSNALALAEKYVDEENADYDQYGAVATQDDISAQVEALDAAIQGLVLDQVKLPVKIESMAEGSSVDPILDNTLAPLQVTKVEVDTTAAVAADTVNVDVAMSNLLYKADTVSTPSQLQFVAYDLKDGNGYQVATGSAIQFSETGNEVVVVFAGVKADATEIPVALGYVQQKAAEAAVSLFALFDTLGVNDDPFAPYGDDIETVYTTIKFAETPQATLIPEITGNSATALASTIEAADALKEETRKAGATDAQLSALDAAIAAAKDMQQRNQDNKVTDAEQLEKTTVALKKMMDTMPVLEQVATPSIIANASAKVGEAVKVIIINAVEGAVIHYTTDGSDPTEASAEYDAEAGLQVTSDTAGTVTVKAIAVKANMLASEIATKIITFTESTSGGSGSGSGPIDSEDEVSKYWVPIELQKEFQYETSMGNVAFTNRPEALAIENSDGTYDIEVATNPVKVEKYRSAIVSIDVNGYDVEILQEESYEAFDGKESHPITYVAKFRIKNVPAGTEYIKVTFNVPYTPMDTAVPGDLNARLCFDWDAKTLAGEDEELTPSMEEAKGNTEFLSEAVDLTDDATGIRLTADEDVLPEGTAMTIDAITSGSSFDTASKALDGIAESFKLYDIKVQAEGEDVEPSTTVKLYLPIPSDYDSSKVAVYRINEDGTKVVVKGTVEEGKYVIETKTFGLYSVALTNTVQQQAVNTTCDEAVAKVVAKYPDINNHWAASSIAFMVNRGLMGSVADGQFGPNLQLTRGMLVTILGRLEGFDASKYAGQSSFSDVNKDAWYAASVQWAAQQGIVSGIGDGKFAPDQAITREQLAAILANYAAKKNIQLKDGPSIKFADSGKISPWAKNAMDAMVKAGIIRGNADGTLNPQGTATRAEVAAMLQRFIVNYVDAQD